MNPNELPAQEYVEALTMQRNAACDQAAMAMARSVAFQKENEVLKAKIVELTNQKPKE